MSAFKAGIEQLIKEQREENDEQLASVSDDWLTFNTVKPHYTYN